MNAINTSAVILPGLNIITNILHRLDNLKGDNLVDSVKIVLTNIRLLDYDSLNMLKKYIKENEKISKEIVVDLSVAIWKREEQLCKNSEVLGVVLNNYGVNGVVTKQIMDLLKVS